MPQDRRFLPRPTPERRRRPRPTLWQIAKHLLPFAVLLSLVGGLVMKGDLGPDPVPYVAPPPAVSATDAPSWKKAARRVEEPRGEAMGRAATVPIPSEMRHYADTRRFLAIQVAAWREQGHPRPHDDAELAEMIRRGDLVPVPVFGDWHVLYGVGANASDDPLFHYEERTGQRIPLFARYDLYQDAAEARKAEIVALQSEAALRADELKRVLRKERKRRAALTAALRQAKADAATLQRRQDQVASFYEDEDRRRMLTREWAVLEAQAASFPDRPYNLETARDRRVLRARMLSYIRKEALEVMMEIAGAYYDKFSRPLAFTSLVRTDEYQSALGETNPNATRIDAPPHTTGLAFDLYYRYMTAAEQSFVMRLMARMEQEGRLEALRENRDHIHAFVFATGRRPPEQLVAESLGEVRPTQAAVPRAQPAGTRRAVLGRKTPSRARAVASRKSAPRASVGRTPSGTRKVPARSKGAAAGKSS